MKTCEEIQHENLLALIKEAGGEKELAKLYECTPAYIKQIARRYKDSESDTPKGFGPVTARRLEFCMGKDRGWIDNDHSFESEELLEIAALLAPLSHRDRLKVVLEVERIVGSPAFSGRTGT